MLKKLMSWALPYTCILCNNYAKQKLDLCLDCYKSLPFSPYFGLQKPLALFIYTYPIPNLILDIKFNKNLVNAQVLGTLLATKLEIYYQTAPKPEYIIPMPLHPQRLKTRGFNQALEIARPIGRSLKIPFNHYAVQRSKPTLPQATLPRAQRKSNVAAAFTISAPLSGTHIAVIDDVITTGHTMQAFCQLLQQHGITNIDIWCIAKALMR